AEQPELARVRYLGPRLWPFGIGFLVRINEQPPVPGGGPRQVAPKRGHTSELAGTAVLKVCHNELGEVAGICTLRWDGTNRTAAQPASDVEPRLNAAGGGSLFIDIDQLFACYGAKPNRGNDRSRGHDRCVLVIRYDQTVDGVIDGSQVLWAMTEVPVDLQPG